MNYACNKGLVFPDNITLEIFQDDVPAPIPHDYLPTLYYLGYLHDTRDGDILFGYYRDGLTYQELAERYGISGERVRQIVAKEISRLRRPLQKKLLTIGLKEYHESALDDLRDSTVTLTEAREKEIRADVKLELRQHILACFNEEEEILTHDTYRNPIDSLNLSVRSTNALLRAGITTVGEIIAMGPFKLARVKNLGRKSFEEIADILATSFGENRGDWPYSPVFGKSHEAKIKHIWR